MATSELWICQVCGREGPSRAALRNRDASCSTWAVRGDPATVKRYDDGRVAEATAWGAK